jgi:hypothetical protein
VHAITAFLIWLWSALTYLPRQLAVPDKLEKAKVFLAGEGDHLWAAAGSCGIVQGGAAARGELFVRCARRADRSAEAAKPLGRA